MITLHISKYYHYTREGAIYKCVLAGIQDEDLYQAAGEVLKTFKLKGNVYTNI